MIKSRYKVVEMREYASGVKTMVLSPKFDDSIPEAQRVSDTGQSNLDLRLDITNPKFGDTCKVGDEYIITAEKTEALVDN